MRWGVLGPLLVTDDLGDQIPLPAGRLRILLAVLLIRANDLVPLDELVDILWDGTPPAGADRTIRVYVVRLRRVLGPTAGARIITQPRGYLCRVGEDEFDLLRFEKLCARARSVARDQEWARAADLLADALDLWRGAPLSDAPSQLLRSRELPRLDRLHLDAIEAHVDAEIQLRRHDDLVPRLYDLIARYPLRERLYAQLMLVLARVGRRSDALEVYRQARHVLVTELGIEPGTELRDLHARVLRGDPAVAPPARPDPPSPLPAVPRQLPAAIPHFTGRTAELTALSTLLDRGGRAAGAVVISAIGGTAGIGKTALALHWGRQAAARFPDGQLYVNLCGFDPSAPPVDPAIVVRRFLDALTVPPARIPVDPEEQVALYRSHLAGRRVLVVLDNARDEQQVRPLLPGEPGCLVLVTSRTRLTGLVARDGAVPVNLDLLTSDESQQLLASRLGADRLGREEQVVDELIDLCARLPLALSVVAARAALQPGMPLAVLVGELRDARRRLDVLTTGDSAADIRAVFSWSYQALPPETARVFRLMGLHPGPDIGVPAVASLAEVDRDRARRLLDELTAACLITEDESGRYGCHDLLTAYAVELTRDHDPRDAVRAATLRMLDHYLHTADRAFAWVYPSWTQLDLPPPVPGVVPENFASRDEALAWYGTEHKALIAAVARAGEEGFDRHVWQLAWTLAAYLERHGHWQEWAAVGQAALAAGQRSGDLIAQAHAHRWLGDMFGRRGQHQDAHTHLRQALALYEQLGDGPRQATAHLTLGVLLGQQARYAEALAHEQQALRLSRAEGDLVGQARTLNAVGWFHAMLKDYGQALAHCEEALSLSEDPHLQAAVRDSLGYIHHQRGDYDQAITQYLAALRIRRSTGDYHPQAEILAHLGDAYHALGAITEARESWRQALAILEDLDDPDADDIRTRLDRLDREQDSADHD